LSLKTWLRNAYCEALYRSGLVTRARPASPVILHYHRIDTGVYERQMEYLARSCEVIPLDHAVGHLLGESVLHRGGVAITFDDAYRSLYDDVGPILSRYRLPATIYAVSDAMGGSRALWFDLVEWAIFSWQGDYGELLPEDLTQAAVGEDSTETRRRTLSLLRGYSVEERDRCVAEMLERAGLAGSEVPRRYQCLTWYEAREMLEGGLITFGGHTRTHPILTRVSAERAWDEIAGSKERMEMELGCSLTHFAYPNGQPGDFDSLIAGLVAKAGYRTAVTTVPGRVSRAVDPYALPRWGIDEDDTLAAFAVKVAGLWPRIMARGGQVANELMLSPDRAATAMSRR